MIKEKTKVKKQQPKWFAIQHAAEQNENNIGLYDAAALAKATRLRTIVEWAFPINRVFINYRKNFITIKVEDAELRDAKKVHVAMLGEICNQYNIEVLPFGEHLLFRFCV